MKLKKYKADDLQAAAWRAAVNKVNIRQEEVVPEGWFTPEQVAEKLGYCTKTGMVKCRDMVRLGMAEKRDFRVQWGQMIRPRPHYRLVKK
ncbi:MAG: hypothetical protein EBT75_07185 [Proteobacteria bacterium]|nr:hypothetical protein [Pseudomonadota bacterium]NBS49864.1 hypothetical protein [Verrucomicrobiota bacterium]